MKPADKILDAEMTLPADESFVQFAIGMAGHYANLIGFPQEDIYKIQLAVEEAVLNVIRHGFLEPYDKPIFNLSFSLSDPLGICIRISEKGMPFDPSKLAEYDPAKASEDLKTSGLGVKLIRGMMDVVEYRNLGVGGKETILMKFRKTDDPRRGASENQLADEDEKEAEPPKPIVYTVRRLKPEEAIEVCRAAYRSHGYTFFNDVIYYPEKIWELNESGHMISVVAVTRRNELIGHEAIVLTEPGARIGEATFAFVNKEYRHQNCLKDIVKFLLETAMASNMVGVYVYAVTVHLYSQHLTIESGGTPVGIELAKSPMTWEFKGIAEHLTQRMGEVLFFRYLRKPQPRILYPPQRHEKMIARLYAGLQAPHTFEKGRTLQAENLPEDSIIHTDIQEVAKNAEIWVNRAGKKFIMEVRRILRKLCVSGISAVGLYLSLEDGTAACYGEEFEKMGFFFAGILPETVIGDALILQYLNNIDVDYGAMKVIRGETEALLKYIRDCDPNLEV